MAKFAPWLVRAGAALAAAAVFLPPVGTAAFGGDDAVRALWLVAPLWAAALLFAGSLRAGRESGLIRGVSLGFLLAEAFAMATYGSILGTATASGEGPETGSPSAAVVLFLAPLACAGAALAMLLGSASRASLASFVRAAIGLLLLADALCLWTAFAAEGARALPGLSAAGAGGLLAAAGEAAALLPRAPDPSRPCSATR